MKFETVTPAVSTMSAPKTKLKESGTQLTPVAKRNQALDLPSIKQIPKLESRQLLVGDDRWQLATPRPLLLQLGIQSALQHFDNVLPKHREELEAMKRPTCGDV